MVVVYELREADGREILTVFADDGTSRQISTHASFKQRVQRRVRKGMSLEDATAATEVEFETDGEDPVVPFAKPKVRKLTQAAAQAAAARKRAKTNEVPNGIRGSLTAFRQTFPAEQTQQFRADLVEIQAILDQYDPGGGGGVRRRAVAAAVVAAADDDPPEPPPPPTPQELARLRQRLNRGQALIDAFNALDA